MAPASGLDITARIRTIVVSRRRRSSRWVSEITKCDSPAIGSPMNNIDEQHRRRRAVKASFEQLTMGSVGRPVARSV